MVSTKIFQRFKGKLSSKHKAFVSHLYNVGPTSYLLTQHCINDIQMFTGRGSQYVYA